MLFVVLLCSVVGVCGVVIFVLYVMRVVGGGVFMGNMCGSSCICYVLVSVVHAVAILTEMFCIICVLLMFVSDASGDHMVETYLSMGLVLALYVASIVSFCIPHVVDVSALIVLRAFVVVIYMCLLL